MMNIFVGCAGWSLRKDLADLFPASGTHLERYATRFNAVEINSSFYRAHRHSTYARWAGSVPENFRFAVKMPREITHRKRLIGVGIQVDQFISEIGGLGNKLGAVLVQLPPSLAFQPSVGESFLHDLRTRLVAAILCEPRHRTWFEPAADALLRKLGIGRVAADPSVVPAAADPGGCERMVYFRWHGSPRMYYSSYDEKALQNLRDRMLLMAEKADQVWSVFDNTAEGEATKNAMRLCELLGTDRG